jgi:hypothetical protein
LLHHYGGNAQTNGRRGCEREKRDPHGVIPGAGVSPRTQRPSRPAVPRNFNFLSVIKYLNAPIPSSLQPECDSGAMAHHGLATIALLL